MELTWPIKIRIGIAAAVGIGLLGVIGWPFVAPAEPMGVVSVVSGTISGGDAMALMGLAFVSGIVSYFLSWPMGKQEAAIWEHCFRATPLSFGESRYCR
jgi:hypothetical protein